MSNRLKYLEQFGVADNIDTAFFNAFVACLAPEEACSAFDTQFVQPNHLRQALLKAS